MAHIRTTKEQFNTFQEEALKWQKKLGLTDWKLYFKHEVDDDRYGSCTWSVSDSIATIMFTKKWDDLRPLTDSEISKCAFHEVCHVLFAYYCAAAEARFSTQEQLDSAEHSIIRRLETLMFEGKS